MLKMAGAQVEQVANIIEECGGTLLWLGWSVIRADLERDFFNEGDGLFTTDFFTDKS